ncbi:MAG: hypothetical protein AAEJ53_10885, partial [Myxococcota bacterium]
MVDFDPFSESYYDDPFRFYALMRKEAPALYLEEYDCFFLSRFQDCWEGAADPRFSSAAGTTSIELMLGGNAYGGKPRIALSSTDLPRHTRLRKALAPRFLPGQARALEPLTRRLTRSFLDEMVPSGGFDVIGD